MTAFLQASLTGAILIAVIALLRLLFRNQLSRRVFLALWLLAVVRLLVPVSLPSPTSIYNLLPFSRDVAVTMPKEAVQTAPMEELPPVVEQPRDETSSAPVVLSPATEEPALSLGQLLTIVWAAVGLCLFLGLELRHLWDRRRYRFSLPLPEGVSVPEGLQVRMLDALESPLSYGLFRPTVLLPVRCLEQPEQLQHILLHEQAHIRNGDLWKKHLFVLTACIHWFNPMVWLMMVLTFEDMEVRCDAVAVGKLGLSHKKEYAKTLVASESARLNDLLHSGFSHSTMAQRLKALIHLRRRPVLSAVVCICLATALFLCFMTGPMTLSARAEQLPPPETALQGTLDTAPTLPEDTAEQQPSASVPPESSSETLSTEEIPSEERLWDDSELTVKEYAALHPTEETEAPTQAQTDSYQGGQDLLDDDVYLQVLQRQTSISVTRYPDETINVGDSGRGAIQVTHYGRFYTDRPDIIGLSSEMSSFFDRPTTNMMSWNGYYLNHAVSIMGRSPGTATIYYAVNGLVYTLFTITVEETLPLETGAANPIGG